MFYNVITMVIYHMIMIRRTKSMMREEENRRLLGIELSELHLCDAHSRLLGIELSELHLCDAHKNVSFTSKSLCTKYLFFLFFCL